MILICIVALAVSIFFARCYYSPRNRLRPILGGILCAIIAFAFFFGLAYAWSMEVPMEETVFRMIEKTEIVALKDNSGVSGSRYLTHGSISSTDYYYYAISTSMGYLVKNERAGKCYVQHSDETPCIETYQAVGFKHWYTWLYAVPSRDFRVFKVPDGAFQTVFEVDLE